MKTHSFCIDHILLSDMTKNAHSELGRILNSVNHGFFSRDHLQDRYTYLSPACEKIYGYTVQEFLNNNRLWFEVIHPDDKNIIQSDEERLKLGEHVYSQYRIVHKDGSIRWLELTLIPGFTNGVLTGIDGVVNDCTLRKKVETERELMISELLKINADLKQFSYITSHNLRAPLSNILGILQFIDRDKVGEENSSMLGMLEDSALQLKKTIDDITNILIIKNNTSLHENTSDINEVYEKVIPSFTRALNDINASIHTDFQSTRVRINKVYVESIFVNLISNAIKYRSPHRNLLININSQPDGRGNVILLFTDNGTGIDIKRHKERLFGLYQRFHENIEGQGLGLFMLKSQIEASGGRIDVESEPDNGVSFIITLKQM